MTRPVKSWQSDVASNASLIADRKSDLKILLKTKNDRWLLNEWISHHANICGICSLIVFDNDFDNQEVLDTYNRLGDDLLVFKFSGHHNNLHFVDKNPQLYELLAQSCNYFIFLDTDEFLFWIDADGKYFSQFTDRLSNAIEPNYDFLGGIWLPNVAWDASRYWVGDDYKILIDGVKWGKPLLKASAVKPAFVNHNVQAFQSGLLPAPCASFFIQHRHRLFLEQRMMSNVNKLRQRNVPVSLQDEEQYLRDLLRKTTDPNIVLYLTEMIDLRSEGRTEKNYTRGYVTFASNGSLEFPGQGERDILLSAVTSPNLIIDKGLS